METEVLPYLYSGKGGHVRGEKGSPVFGVLQVKDNSTGVLVVLNVGPYLRLCVFVRTYVCMHVSVRAFVCVCVYL